MNCIAGACPPDGTERHGRHFSRGRLRAHLTRWAVGLPVGALLLGGLTGNAAAAGQPTGGDGTASSWAASASAVWAAIGGDGSAPYQVTPQTLGADSAPMQPDVAAAALTTTCTGPNTAEARRRKAAVSSRVTAAAMATGARVAVTVYDYRSGISCSFASTRTYDSASTVKATILAALLLQAQDHHRSLTSTEKAWAKASITRSDNAATTKLWNRIGGTAGLTAFLKRARMTHTVAGRSGYWGLTQITSADEVVLLRVLARPGLLTAASRAYELGLMRAVISSQRWGVTAGVAPGTTVALKNGWLPRSTAGWRVHSIGYVTGSGHDYVLAVLSDRNSTMSAGVGVVQSLARAVNTALR